MGKHPKTTLRLQPEAVESLRELLHGGVQPVRVMRRAQCLLLLTEGKSAIQVGKAVGLSTQAVRNISRRYRAGQLAGVLREKPRPGAERRLDDSEEQRIIAMVCADPPEGTARWTVRLIAAEAVRKKIVNTVGRETIRLLLERRAVLSRGGIKMWCVPELTPNYITCMEDVLALYEQPYKATDPVVCFDEKPLVLHDEVRLPVPAKPTGRIAKPDSEYKRCGTANVFCAVEPLAGRHFAWPTKRRSAADFVVVVESLVSAYRWATTIHIVLDNLNIHCRKSLTDYFGEQKGGYIWSRLIVHHTPKHGSWLNQAEIEIGLYSRQCLGRRRLASLNKVTIETRAWIRRVNGDHLKISWKFDRKDARASLSVCTLMTRSRH